MAATVTRLGANDVATLRSISRRFKRRDVDDDTAASLLARDDVVVLATIEGGAPIGFALAYLLPRLDRAEGMLFVYELDVAEEHRRQGHGRAMLDMLKAFSAEWGLMKMFISTGEDNEVAQTLFATAGGERALRGNLWYGWSEGDDGW
jgi:aminoglycoside 3-N-acetyltransferase I